MADRSQPDDSASKATASHPSTRRSSNASGADLAASQQFGTDSQSSGELSRKKPPRSQPRMEGYGSITSPASGGPSRYAAGSPDTKGLKPSLKRRSTSHGPHRGQEFSVDDTLEEADKDQALHRHQPKAGTHPKSKTSTIRKRPTPQMPALAKVDSQLEDVYIEQESASAQTNQEPESATPEDTAVLTEDEEDEPPAEDEGDVSDAESFTLKDRQQAINETHPFGIRIWKPALYKKNRSVQKTAEQDVHSIPGGFVSKWLLLFNLLWTLLFGWWLALIAFTGALTCMFLGIFNGCADYGRVLLGLSSYLFYPFGKYIKLVQDDAYIDEDEGEGRSISEYERWQSGDLEEGRLFFGPIMNRSLIGRRRPSADSTAETESLLGRAARGTMSDRSNSQPKRRLFGRGKWTVGRVVFFIFFYGLLTPCLFLVSGICWFLVFTIPMGKVTMLLLSHLRRHPLALSFHSDTSDTRQPGTILVCTYRAIGPKYWKYTIDGTNIFLFNFLALVAFVIIDFFLLREALGLDILITNPFIIFAISLLSTIPLAYFIGQAVASISAQSSMGVGATINAFFSTVVEVYLYCVALQEGKSQLVEGSIIGSIFAGVLFLPGLSMCFGALKRKTQRFNVQSAGVTSTMLLFAVIGAFAPTLFYQIYGSHELQCHQCVDQLPGDRDCRRCFFSQVPAVGDHFYREAIQPYTWFSAVMLFLSYVTGLLFTLRTHAAVIWSNEPDEKRAHLESSMIHQGVDHAGFSTGNTLNTRTNTGFATGTVSKSDVRDSQLYKRIFGQTERQLLGPGESEHQQRPASPVESPTPHIVPPPGRDNARFRIESLSEEDNRNLVRQVTEIATTAATIATRDAVRKPSANTTPAAKMQQQERERLALTRLPTTTTEPEGHPATDEHGGGGHDAPNWSRTKSAMILLSATVAYALVAEILVNTVDSVLNNFEVDEKFLGITLFALVPNATEFLNAISFAMNGNIALSMEIGSAYALQVCLLQIPCLVLFSAIYAAQYLDPESIPGHTFSLIFPQWDMVTVILCVFLLSYMYGEGKSNYFKGSILVFSYFVVIFGFYLSGFNSDALLEINPTDTLAINGRLKPFTVYRDKPTEL
ncbi:calcium/proton exchanger [Eremomyces bilateralis CBS 781.70]|uniref:Calcium/proton exchanger n=1 Tax=Eremomyces bilateralis CBS 781.70 TaxID=1392243 RepID=A0A6G1G9H2_9PEZI|nr:calcium/proton exchanger [Eremomyces bilateralis CBS 781.70]KAF1814735.1 calcium/proton exchanger [Eremomyces bilateralis CBS 781.70]